MLGKSGKKKKKKNLTADPTKMNDLFLESDEEEDDIPSWNPWYLEPGRTLDVGYIDLSDDDRSTVSEGIPSKDPQWFTKEEISKVGEFWQIQKLVKFVRVGDQTTTAVCLACLADFDYSLYSNQIAFLETGGLEILINLLQAFDLRCQLGALTILSMISDSPNVQRSMMNLGAVPNLLKLLCSPDREVQIKASTSLTYLTVQRRIRTIIRKKNGIPIMMQLIDRPSIINMPLTQLATDAREEMTLVKNVILALTRIARSMAIRRQLFQLGIVELVPKLLKTTDRDVYICSLQIIQLCASLVGVRQAVVSSKHLKFMVKPLSSGDAQKQELACRLIFKVGLHPEGKAQIGKFQILPLLLSLVKTSETHNNEKLLKYCVGSLCRASRDPNNLDFMSSGSLVSLMLQFMQHDNVFIRSSAAGCLAECSMEGMNQMTVLKSNGLPLLVSQLNKDSNTELLENLTNCMGHMAECPECENELRKLETMRIVWSHIDGKTEQLQVNACLALVPMIRNSTDSAELVRSYVGGLEMLLDKLDSDSINVIAAACEALAQVMTDEENLMILSDLGIVDKLTSLTKTENDMLRESLARAIASCVMSSNNSTLFGKLGAITPMVHYLASQNPEVVVAAAYALWKLSMEPINCITLHRSGVVPFLVQCVGSEDYRLQEAAAGCLNNIRNLAYEADQRANLMGKIIFPIKKPKMFKAQSQRFLFASSISQIIK